MRPPWLRRQGKPGIGSDGFGVATKVGASGGSHFFSLWFCGSERGEEAAAVASASSWSLPGGRRWRLPPGSVATGAPGCLLGGDGSSRWLLQNLVARLGDPEDDLAPRGPSSPTTQLRCAPPLNILHVYQLHPLSLPILLKVVCSWQLRWRTSGPGRSDGEEDGFMVRRPPFLHDRCGCGHGTTAVTREGLIQ